jgi:crotonobetainyl-CoA:carnitine CoA-transferase CaiB-like acyl-CoA transferase
MAENKRLPLAGLKVLDLTRVRAGPTAVRQLVDWGADVIKIEAPAELEVGNDMGGPRDGSDFQNLNCGKQSLTLNLKKPEGLEIFYRMAREADVIVENYRPDIKDNLKFDYESIKRINPRIIYASISGFGQDGPYCKRPGFDQIVQGMSGLMSITGHPDTPPVRTGIAIADSVTGQMCAQGILLALLERERSGQGQWVQVSLLETLVNLLDFQAVRYLNEGDVPQQMGNDHATRMPTSAYRTQDGYITICAAADNMWRKLCRAIGREDLIEHPDFSNQKGRSGNRRRLNAELESALRQRDSADWVDILNAAGVACGPIYRIDEMFGDEQIRHLDLVRQVEHKQLGQIKVLAQPIRLSASEPVAKSPAPDRGEHAVSILKKLGFSTGEIEGLRSELVI